MAKNTSKKLVKKAPKAPSIKLVSFTITAIIPTEPYGNIQPAITVMAADIDQAKAVVLPHIDALMAKYSMNAPKVVSELSINTSGIKVGSSTKKDQVVAPEIMKVEEKLAADVSVPYQKALNAIKTAYSEAALETISDAIIFSKKLHDGEKIRLKPVVEAKRAELVGK